MALPDLRLQGIQHLDETLCIYITLNGAIYWNRRDKAEQVLQLLEPDAWQMLSWQFDDTIERPSYFVAQTSGGNILIEIAGSVNGQHWWGNFVGGLSATRYGGGYYANAYFKRMADMLWDEITPILPNPVTGKVRIVGHSLGSAVANILGNFFKANQYDVQVLGFAEPRSVSVDFQPPHPDNLDHTRIYIGNEQIGWIPPISAGRYWVISPIDGSPVSTAFTWGHYGRRFDYDQAGAINNFNYDRDDISLLQYPLANMIRFHPIGSYMRAFHDSVDRIIFPRENDALLLINREIRLQSVDRTQNNVRINPNDILNIPERRAFFRIHPDAPFDVDLTHVELGNMEVTADISRFFLLLPDAPQDIGIISTNMASSNLWKMEFLIEDGKYWYTESHVWNPNADKSFEQCFTEAEAYWDVRRKLIGRKAANSTLGGGSPGCTNVRMSQVLHPKVAQSKRLENVSYLGEFDNALGSCDVLEVGILTRMHATQPGGGTVAEGVRHFCLRGIPDELLQDGRRVTNGIWDAAATLWAGYLINNNYGLMVQDQSGNNAKRPITAFSQDDSTKVWTLTVDATGYETFDQVRISKTSVPEMNGTYEIIKLSDTQIKLINGPKQVSSTPLVGKCQRVRLKSGVQCKVFAKYDEILGGREAFHDVKLKLKKSQA